MRKVLLFVCLLMAGMTVNVNAAKQKAKHVILIGMDGWGAYSVSKADIPAIKSLMTNGCYTLHSRSVLPSSSAINWASMFMGVGTELHGYTTWGSKTPEIPSREVNERGIAPTIFSVLREQRPKAEIGCLYEWPGIKYLVDTLAMSYQYQTPGYAKAPTALCEAAEKYIIEKKPELLAICFEEPDHTGHTKGHDTPAYYQMLKELDAGVTMVHVETGYGQENQKGVLCIIPNRKLYSVKELVQSIDPKAFITITQINEVRGRGFSMERVGYEEIPQDAK